MQSQLEVEIDQNFDYFLGKLSSLLTTERGKFALIHNRSIVCCFNRLSEAVEVGNKEFPDRIYSIQEVTDTPIDLGFYSHVTNMGQLC
jgi:hypothetical protein